MKTADEMRAEMREHLDRLLQGGPAWRGYVCCRIDSLIETDPGLWGALAPMAAEIRREERLKYGERRRQPRN